MPGIEPVAAGFRVRTEAEVLEARAVVIALPPNTAAPLTAEVAPRVSDSLRELRAVDTAVVLLGYRRDDVRHPLDGYGLIVPRGEGRRITAAGFFKGSQNGTIPLLLVDGLFVGLLFLCGKWARERSQGAFLAGMIAYGLDGALLLLFNAWLFAAVHAYALYRMWQGYAATRELAQLEQVAQPGLSRAGAL